MHGLFIGESFSPTVYLIGQNPGTHFVGDGDNSVHLSFDHDATGGFVGIADGDEFGKAICHFNDLLYLQRCAGGLSFNLLRLEIEG